MFQRPSLLVLVLIVMTAQGASVPNLAGCAIEYLNSRQMIITSGEVEAIEDDCEVFVTTEITKFYDDIYNLINSGVNIENLENSNFVNHEKCIMEKLKQFNVSDIYLKGIAYHKLEKGHRSDHSFNQRMTSQQILALYALQVCEPRSFYARNAEKIFTMNMRTSNAQAHCLLNHLNENSVVPYQFSDDTALATDLDPENCEEIVRNFVKRYYNVIDRARNFSIFGLNPTKAMKCRASNDKTLINHMILLTLFQRLTFSTEQIEQEKVRFFDIAKDSAQSFFQCISMYD